MATTDAAHPPTDPMRRGLEGVLDAGLGAASDAIGPGKVVMIVLAIGLPAVLLAMGTQMWPAALVAAVFFGGFAFALSRAQPKVRDRCARVRDAVLDHPEDVAEIAHRRGGDPRRPAKYMAVVITLRDGTWAMMRVELEHVTSVLALLTGRCRRAVVHPGFPSKKLRGAPVARVVTR